MDWLHLHNLRRMHTGGTRAQQHGRRRGGQDRSSRAAAAAIPDAVTVIPAPAIASLVTRGAGEAAPDAGSPPLPCARAVASTPVSVVAPSAAVLVVVTVTPVAVHGARDALALVTRLPLAVDDVLHPCVSLGHQPWPLGGIFMD